MLAVAGGIEQAQKAVLLMREQELAGLSDEERAAAEHVVDLDSEEITCPACTHTFKTGPQSCPDCGLRLG